MNFATWTRALSARGFQVVPPSHAVPVELWALLPEGGLVHFRCRGTRVSLDRYAETDLVFVELPAHCACDGGCADRRRADAGAVPPMVRIRPGARPIDGTRYDGAHDDGAHDDGAHDDAGRARRWSGHEAGLLTIAEAAGFFDALYARLHEADLPVGPYPRLTPAGSGASRSADRR